MFLLLLHQQWPPLQQIVLSYCQKQMPVHGDLHCTEWPFLVLLCFINWWVIANIFSSICHNYSTSKMTFLFSSDVTKTFSASSLQTPAPICHVTRSQIPLNKIKSSTFLVGNMSNKFFMSTLVELCVIVLGGVLLIYPCLMIKTPGIHTITKKILKWSLQLIILSHTQSILNETAAESSKTT